MFLKLHSLNINRYFECFHLNFLYDCHIPQSRINFSESIAPIVLYMRPGKGNVSNSWAFELMKMTEWVLPSSSTKVYLMDWIVAHA